MSRIMMQVVGRTQPLSFDASGPREPLLNSATTAWAGVPFELHQTQPTHDDWQGGAPEGEHQLMVIVDGAFEVVRHVHGRDLRFRATPGSLSFHSGAAPGAARVVGSARAVVVNASGTWSERMLHEGARSWPRSYGVPGPDETARSLALAMCSEVSRGAATGSLFAESLSLALLSHALHRIPAREPIRAHRSLSDRQRGQLRRHIEERLAEDLRLTELAALCGLGPRHFTDLFRRAFGMTPHRYVTQRRLVRAAGLLSSNACDIVEVALRTGFSSQSHFTTAFRQAYGVTPSRYASSHRHVVSILPKLTVHK